MIQGTYTLLIIICLLSPAIAQGQLTRHIVSFRDKKAVSHSLSNPSAYLSSKALLRRQRQNIPIDSTDLPVCQPYIDSIASIPKVRILNASRWLNQVAIQTTDASALARIQKLPFVRTIQTIAGRTPSSAAPNEPLEETLTEVSARTSSPGSGFYNYGNSLGQVRIHQGDYLHNFGFQGQGMTIAVLDAGFFRYLTNPAFDSIRRTGRILGTWDFVAQEASVDEDDAHGANCLSIMASNIPGVLIGTAPAASYYLFRTEDVASEYPIEEHFWAVGAERADSLGADIITSSLGYTDFDDPSMNHTYAKLDGNTTMVTRAADLAAKKGMIVTNSAGNSGNSPWKYIGAPADGDSVLAVGAISVNGNVASFSSYGPSADGQVKPDVTSVGAGTFVITPNGLPGSGNGTSYSNPNIAGLTACLWQAFPELSNMDVIDAVRRSSHKYTNPDDRVGYGIPDMRKAFEDLLRVRQVRQAMAILKDDFIKAFPSPFSDKLRILYKAGTAGSPLFEVMDMQGRIVLRKQAKAKEREILILEMDGAGQLPPGSWLLRYTDGERMGTIHLVK